MTSIDLEKKLNSARETLLLHLKDLSDNDDNNDAGLVSTPLRAVLQKVFTEEVLARLDDERLLEESVVFGSLGPPNVVQAILKKIIPLLAPDSEAEIGP